MLDVYAWLYVQGTLLAGQERVLVNGKLVIKPGSSHARKSLIDCLISLDPIFFL